jgi:putative hydrolase of the HAD superfamily
MVRARALAVDFGGTLATPGPRPDGVVVAEALGGVSGTVVPESFPATFDAVTRRLRQRDRALGIRTMFTEELRACACECGAVIPDLPAAAEAIFTAVPDATVDPRAAHALRQLHDDGLVCVLACDTQRPEVMRRHTLHVAGIAGSFDALVLSSKVGIGKPDPGFYDAVVRAAGCRPEEIVFVGDTPAKDAIGPHEYGMRAVLVTSSPRPDDLPEEIGVIGHFAELPAYLEATDVL